MARYRFSCDRRALARAVRRTADVAGWTRRSGDAGGLWLTIDESSLTLTTTRPPVTFEERVRVHGEGRGALVVPLRPFRRVVLSRRSGTATFEGDNRRIEFRAGAFVAELEAVPPGMVARPLAPVDPVQTASLAGATLRAGLEHVALSMGHRYGWRPDAAGLELTVRDGSVRMAATDLVTLAIAEHDDPSTRIPFHAPVVVPDVALGALARHLAVGPRAEIRVGRHQVDFVTRDRAIRCELPLQTFPEYEPLPTGPVTRRGRIDRGALLDMVERVSTLSRGDSPARVWLEFTRDSVTARTLDRQVGSAADVCPARLEGDPCVVGVHLWTLVACLRQLAGPELVIEIGDPAKRMSIHAEAFPQRRYHFLPLAIDPPA